MSLVGHAALAFGVVLSVFVQYKFYIARDRSQRTYAALAGANFLLLVASRSLPVDLPGIVTVLLWIGFLFGLGIAVFYTHIPVTEPK